MTRAPSSTRCVGKASCSSTRTSLRVSGRLKTRTASHARNHHYVGNIGRTDPKLDPKGRLTEDLMSAAETFYKSPVYRRRFSADRKIRHRCWPEETLVDRLQSGQLDVGFFYSIETADAKIPAVTLPPEITPKATYTVTILHISGGTDMRRPIAALPQAKSLWRGTLTRF
jgi:ABC-type molybdate transport system substrate-binding protein